MAQLNNFGSCKQGVSGTGVLACDIKNFGDVVGLVPIQKGWFKTIDALGNVDLDATIYKNEVKALNLLPLVDIYDFTQDTPTNEINTSSKQVEVTIRSGKPKFSFMFTKGSCFHKAIYTLKGFGRWDFAILFETGILFAKNADETKLKGFDGGRFDVETFKLIQGTDPEMSTAVIQLLDAEEFNARHTFIPFTEIGAVGDVIGAVEAKILIEKVAAGTTFEAEITSKCNVGDPILDLENAANYVLKGTQATPTLINAVAFNATNGKYTFTVDNAFVAGDVVQIELNDGTYQVVEDIAENLYKGLSNSFTVA